MRNILLLILFVPFLCAAQDEFYNKGATLVIQKGVMLHIQGTFTNDTGSTNGVILNDGIIEVDGNFINNPGATFKVSNDTTSKERVVKFTGTGTQLIEGNMSNADSASFYNLVIDQSIVNDSVEMQAPVVIQGSLVFGSTNTTTTYNPDSFYTTYNNGGLLKTFNSSLGEFVLDIQNGDTDAIAGYASLAISGAPATNMVLSEGLRGSGNGGLQRKVSALARYVFPVGTINHGFNATALSFDSIPTCGGSVKGKFCDSTSNPNGVVGEVTEACIGCSQNASSAVPNNNGFNEYFTNNACNGNLPQWVILADNIKNHGYWSFASTNLGYKYSIEAFPNNFTLIGSVTDIWRMLKYPAPYSTDPSTDTANWEPYIEESISSVSDLLTYTRNSGCYTGNGIPGGLYTNFSHFSLRSGGYGDALPVELLYLEAIPINNQYIKVSWSTALEINNAGFKVMRSADGISFTEIAWVAGHDNSTITNNYFTDDHNVTPGVNYYYKLIQVDNNGDNKQSEIVTASLQSANEFTISDFEPNPAFSATKLMVNTSGALNIEVKIFDMLGRQISAQNYQLIAGENELNFNTSILSGATYTGIIYAGDKVYSRNLVVMRD